MPQITVDDIQKKVAAIVDQTYDSDNIDDTDYALRLNFLNQRERMWAEAAKWQVLYKEYNTLTSTNSGNVTVSLPADFRRLASYPKIVTDGSSTDEYPEILPQRKDQYTPTADNYVYILGNENEGYNMVVNPATSSGQLASGVSIYVPYFSVQSSLATSTDYITCPNPDYLVKGIIADVWESKDDNRYQAKQIEAEIVLKNMIESEFTPTEASAYDSVKTVEETRYGFRLGE